MFPVSDVIPPRTRPYAAIILVVVTMLVFLYELQLGSWELRRAVRSYGVVPADLWWPALVTSPFLHGGWVSLLANGLSLWLFGENVEDRLGHAGFLALFVGCAAVGALAQVFASPNSLIPTIGASGAVAGVMGAYFALYPRSRVLTAVTSLVHYDVIEVPAVFYLGLWFLLQLLSGLGSLGAGTANTFWPQSAGFLTGLVVGGAWRLAGAQRSYWR